MPLGHAHLSSPNVYPYKELMLENFVEKKVRVKKKIRSNSIPYHWSDVSQSIALPKKFKK